MARTPRPAREHRATVREAGLGRMSLVSILAGTLTAYGTFAVVAAIAGAILAAADIDTEFRTNDWTSSGFVAGLVTAVVLLVAYLFGGYVAGRMARRSGLLHGLAVVVLSVVLGAVAGLIASTGDDSAIQDNLRSIGIPTSWDQVESIAIFGAVASLVAVILGGILGGILGEGWHTRLARRVADPERGPAADARVAAERDRERADHLDRERDERMGADRVLAREEADMRDHPDPRDGDGDRRPAAPEAGMPEAAAEDRPHYAGHWRR